MELLLEEIITKVRRSKFDYYYEFTEGYRGNYHEPFNQGDAVNITAESSGDLFLNRISKIERANKKDEIIARIENNIKLSQVELLLKDEVTASLKPLLEKTAKQLLLSQNLGRHTLLKFHNDADGVSCAFALTSFLRCYSFQQNSAVYSAKDAVRDLNNLYSEPNPLVVMVDFGANIESEEGLELLHAAGVEVILIDHHPPGEKTKKYSKIVSPWVVSDNEDCSKYTAGYLCVEIARLAGSKGVDELAYISCAGDKSNILEVSQSDKDKALVLDYMTSYTGFGNSLDFYKNVMNQKELFTSMLHQAKEKIEEITRVAQKSMRIDEINGIYFHILDLENIMKSFDFPSRGKIATQIFESLDNSKPNVVLGYGKGSVIFRVNPKAVDKGFKANEVIDKIKESMRDFIRSGGGHAKAAAVLTQSGFAKEVIEEVLRVSRFI